MLTALLAQTKTSTTEDIVGLRSTLADTAKQIAALRPAVDEGSLAERLRRATLDAINLREELDRLNDFVGQNARELTDEMRSLSESAVQSLIGAAGDIKTTRQTIADQYGTITAEYTQAIGVVAGTTTTLVTDVTQLALALNGYTGVGAVSSGFNALQLSLTVANGLITTTSTNVTNLASALNGYTGANAVATALGGLQTQVTNNNTAASNAITSLNTAVGSVSANATFRMQAVSALDGAAATIGFYVSALPGGAPASASGFLSARSDGTSEWIFDCTRFLITNGTNYTQAFVYSGSTLYVNALVAASAIIGTLNVGTLIADHAIITNKLATDAATDLLTYDLLGATYTGASDHTSGTSAWKVGVRDGSDLFAITSFKIHQNDVQAFLPAGSTLLNGIPTNGYNCIVTFSGVWRSTSAGLTHITPDIMVGATGAGPTTYLQPAAMKLGLTNTDTGMHFTVEAFVAASSSAFWPVVYAQDHDVWIDNASIVITRQKC
jgi:hypothetical protein